jgi:hypothetical protein
MTENKTFTSEPPTIIDQNVKTDDILYRPKWWRWDSWKFHAFVIFALMLTSTATLSMLSVAYPVMFGMNTQIVYNSANIALNWTALAYAIYIYKIYDDTKQKATAKMQESGIQPISIEEGLGQLLHQVKKVSDWLDTNREELEKLYQMGKGLDLEKIIHSIEDLSKMLDNMQEHGFNQERFTKLFVLFEKVDLDKAIELVEGWNESQKRMRQLDEMEASLPPKRVCPKHPNVTINETGFCEMCDLERKYMEATRPSETKQPKIPPMRAFDH